jgi:benzoyl-CoA reductase/2-hydroxyglutaryl-CoA dehydratase subunit BcrC/BadD/HgdB
MTREARDMNEIIRLAKEDPGKLKIYELEKLQRMKKAEAKKNGLTASEKQRNKMARRQNELREAARNIGEIPAIKDPARREAGRLSLLAFILNYAGDNLSPFSEDHNRVIKRIKLAIFGGGRFVEAVYRGFGKSTLSNLATV